MAPMTAEALVRFEAANLCAAMAADAFLRGDYVSASRWWIEAAQEATTVSAKKACIANAKDAWALVVLKGMVH